MKMNQQAKRLALASAIALSMGGTVGGALADDVTEARQESQIWTTYALSPHLQRHDIKVEVNGDTAILTGKVDEEVNRELAKQIALGVSGIENVENRIEVAADYDSAKDPKGSKYQKDSKDSKYQKDSKDSKYQKDSKDLENRTYGDIVADATITAAVKSKLLWNRNTQGTAVDVETKDGKVSLEGTANSAAARDLAGALALNTHGVVAVDNQLMVDESMSTPGEKAKETTDDVGQSFSDGWITTKVKSTFMYSSNINSSRISVETENGVVNLSGTVNTAAEKALAVELAGNIKGVTDVNDENLSHL